MLSRDGLFLHTLADLAQRVEPGKSEYELLMVAALLRKLLLDSDPLLHQVNRGQKLKVVFSATERAIPSDPTPIIWSIQDGLDPETAVPALGTVRNLKLDRFLELPVAFADGHIITVGALIRFLAHVGGAVHAGQPGNPVEEAIARFALTIDIGGPMSGSVRSLLAIGRVVLKALNPLREQVERDMSGVGSATPTNPSATG